MTDITALREIERRLTEAKDGDPELDLCLLNIGVNPPWKWREFDRGTITRDKCGPDAIGNPVCSLDEFTYSLDAAIALCERTLNGREWKVGVDLENGKAWAAVGDDHWDECHYDVTAEAKTPALALCLAVVRALIAQEKT